MCRDRFIPRCLHSRLAFLNRSPFSAPGRLVRIAHPSMDHIDAYTNPEILMQLDCAYPWRRSEEEYDQNKDDSDEIKDDSHGNDQRKQDGSSSSYSGHHDMVFMRDRGSPAAVIKYFANGRGRDCDLLLVRSAQDGPGYGRLLDPRWRNLDLARSWKRECLDQHGERCSNPFRMEAATPAWLIDTAKVCLVPGSHATTLVEPRLPPTIRHAMQLVLSLGERYLWIDALCIAQDDEEHLAKQLRLMGAIYASAILTIVAAEGSAKYGMPGLPGISRPRNPRTRVFRPKQSDDEVFVWHRPVFSSNSGGEGYFSHGWTFQEYQLSRRRLIFANQRVYWRCACANRDEDLHDAMDYTDSHPLFLNVNLPRMLSAPKPDYRSLVRLLAEYNGRVLTYPQDALVGITGLPTLVEPCFPGGFLYGLPEARFDSCLAWTSLNGMKRRRANGTRGSMCSLSGLPSWSWVGWHSFRMYDYCVNTFKTRSHLGSRSISITQWYTHQTPDVQTKRPIMSRWHSGICDDAPPVAKSKTPCRRDHLRLLDDFGDICGALDHFADDDDDDNDDEEERQGHMSFPGPNAKDAPKVELVAICRTQHKSSDGRRPAPYGLELEVLEERQAELKARYGEEAAGKKAAGKKAAGQKTSDFYEVYRVLWVKWKDGVAYRKAAGYVFKDAWESHSTDEVHLVMG
ncbi:hypothetical protein CMUS01_16382 [Colletotrichum musicola]|uniref:Heterokaryon incompatibility domain-containing protein n=1 Tax=Colletotrichum musicola TaxID=2175873 RepID=A0A8H6MJ77_9PEZI|nr:hypothetical protein CMUS01_16382 [Colletotrichum musicola]